MKILKSKERKLAEKIKILLNKRGFIVDIRESRHSKSIYIKLDNGACSGIRISDHKKTFKDKTNFKFNVIKNYNGIRNEFDNGSILKFYNYNSIGRLICDIETERSSKIIKYGYEDYRIKRDKIKYNYMKNSSKVA